MTTVDRIALALTPLDALRAAFLRAFGSPFRRLFSDRDGRVVVLASLSTCVSFGLAVLFPTWMAILGPLVLGVPHLLSDVRYLVARPRVWERGARMALVLVPVAATWIWPRFYVGACSLLVLACVASGPLWRRGIVAAAGACAVAVGRHYGYGVDLVFAHAHNVIALLLWWLWAPRTARHAIPIALVVVGVLLIGAGAMDSAPLVFGGAASVSNVELPRFAEVMSLGGDAEHAMRWALFFLFTQGVHYVVWLRLVPEDDRERAGVRPFASSFRALVKDIGLPTLALTAFVSIGLGAYAFVDTDAARIGYLRGAVFHGYLELAALALLFVEGRQFFAARLGK